jgi:hypothetical protein
MMRAPEGLAVTQDEGAVPQAQRIGGIIEAQERLLADMAAAVENKDLSAQRTIIRQLAELESKLKRIEASYRIGLQSVMLAVGDARTPQERLEKLLAAFGVIAWIRSSAQDDLVDDSLSDEADAQMRLVIGGLDETQPNGRKALIGYLGSHNPDQRACAAVALLDLMPDRVLPVLRDLAENEPGTNAGATALDALSKWTDRAES